MPPSDCVKNVKGIFRLIRSFTAEAIEREKVTISSHDDRRVFVEKISFERGENLPSI